MVDILFVQHNPVSKVFFLRPTMFSFCSNFLLPQQPKYNLTNIPYLILNVFRSQELLVCPQEKLTADFVNKLFEKPLKKCSSITCMTTLKKNSQDTYDISCPVLATEIGNIYILDPQTFTVLHQVRILFIR